MVRVVLSATLFACLGIILFILINRLPYIRDYRDCYRQAYEIHNEKGLLTRSSYVTDAEICLSHKDTLLIALTCQQAVDEKLNAGVRKQVILDNLGHLAAFGTLTMSEMTTEHNRACRSANHQLHFSSNTNTWF